MHIIEHLQFCQRTLPATINVHKQEIEGAGHQTVLCGPVKKEKLSERAVVKETGLGRVYLQGRRMTPKGT